MTVGPTEVAEREASRARRWPWILTGSVVALLLGLGIGLAARPYVYSGTVIQSSSPAPAMTDLVYDDGQPVELDHLRGQVVLVYFGYTNCPDLCPTMLSTVDRALENLGSRSDDVTTMMVTVDPVRDKIGALGDYVRRFNPAFRGVWGSEASVRSVATRYGVHFEHDEAHPSDDYLIAHTAWLLAIDPEGALRLTYPVGVTSEELARDLRELLG